MMSSVTQPPSSLPFVSPQFFILLLLIFFLEILAIMLFFIYQDEVRRLDSHWVRSSCYSPQRTMLKRDSVSVRLCFRGVFMSVNHIVCWFSIEHIHWHFFLQHWFSTIYIYFFSLGWDLGGDIYGFESWKLKTWSSSCVVETSYWTGTLDISISVHIPIE